MVRKNSILIKALIIPILLLSCDKQVKNENDVLLKVNFRNVTKDTANIEKKYPGAIEGAVNVDIRAQVTGYLDQIYVKEGEYVNKGKVLFRLKSDVYQQQVINAKAAYESSLATQRSAAIEVQKIKPLVQGKVYTELQLQTAEANLIAANAQAKQAHAVIGETQINMGFTSIKAPVSGYIGRIPNRVGNLISSTDTLPLTTLSDINNIFAYFSLNEVDFIEFIKNKTSGQLTETAQLLLADNSLYQYTGKIEMGSGNIERNTGSIALKAVFSNPQHIIRSGASGKVVLTKQLNDVISIPMDVVKDIQNRYFVFKLSSGNVIRMTPIEILGKSGKNYIIKSGLKQGDKIATGHIDLLTDNIKVIPTIK
ncbi:efflux RND transporter periplasmic adaptor subunit [Chryseobacterium sp. MYb328]|uniref:efflux RND transporter periplasmic adaptor subunit n=1 Tax=Chryseobacterium sp. MYb328 TaxID=2745231 RepID=UPI0030ECE651